MKVGDLVRADALSATSEQTGLFESGIVIGFRDAGVIVFWSKDFPNEWEYPEQLEVISESR